MDSRYPRFGSYAIAPLLLGSLALDLAGRGYTPGRRALSRGGIGAGAGAIIGAATGLGPASGALIGGAVGAVTGAVTKAATLDLGRPLGGDR